MTRPMATAGDRPAPLPVLALLRAVSDEPDAENHDEDADDQPRRDAQDPLKGRRPVVDRVLEFWSVVRTDCRMPTLAALAPIANPASTTHAPSAPSPRRYQELPAHPPPRIMPTPKTKPPVRLASQRNGRTGIDSTRPELQHVDADDRDEERQHVRAHDRRVAHEHPVGQRAREAEAAALRAVAEGQSRQERAPVDTRADVSTARDLSGAGEVAASATPDISLRGPACRVRGARRLNAAGRTARSDSL